MPFNATPNFNPLLGGLQAAQAVKEAVDEYRQNQGIDSMNDSIMQHAVALNLPKEQGGITMEDYNDWKKKGFNQRQGIANGVQANLLDTFRRQQQASLEAERKAQANYYNAHAAQLNAQKTAALTGPTQPVAPEGTKVARWRVDKFGNVVPASFVNSPLLTEGAVQYDSAETILKGNPAAGIPADPNAIVRQDGQTGGWYVQGHAKPKSKTGAKDPNAPTAPPSNPVSVEVGGYDKDGKWNGNPKGDVVRIDTGKTTPGGKAIRTTISKSEYIARGGHLAAESMPDATASPAATPTPTPTPTPSATPLAVKTTPAVIRDYQGRKAYFDPNTKQFIKWVE